MRRENFPPTPGVHCQFCRDAGGVPDLPRGPPGGDDHRRRRALRVAKEMTVAESALKQRKASLSAYTSVHGPTEVSSHKGRRVYGHKSVQRTSRPTKEAMQEALSLARNGVPIDLDSLYRTATTTRFELHEPTGPEAVQPAAEDAALMNALLASVEQAASDPSRTVAPSTTKEEDAA
jgi:hypothetical protein